MKRYLAQFLPTGLLAVIILFFAFSLRVWNLTIIPAFADEAIYIRWSQVMGSEPTLRFLPLSDGKQPLYMWILMFAVRRFSDPLFVGRFLSVLGGMGTLLGIFSVSLLLFKSQKAALLSLLLGSMCPFLFFFDRMALVDSLLCFFGIWTFFFAVVTAKTGRIDAAMVTGFFLGFAWLTKSPALFFLLLLPTTYIFSEFPSLSSRRVLRLLHLVGLSSISVVIAFAMYNILRLGPNFSTIASRNLDYVWPITHVFQSPFDCTYHSVFLISDIVSYCVFP
jgi:4-amino-4-deoxy-L-arabinose transferase-like glycosyltransferase